MSSPAMERAMGRRRPSTPSDPAARLGNVASRQGSQAAHTTNELNAVLRRFIERRETGKPPVDPDAEQLAADVREIVAAERSS